RLPGRLGVRQALPDAGDPAGRGRAAVHALDDGAPPLGRQIAGRRAPDRMREAGELALHPGEVLRHRLGLLLRVLDVDPQELAVIFRPGLVAIFAGGLLVDAHDTGLGASVG